MKKRLTVAIIRHNPVLTGAFMPFFKITKYAIAEEKTATSCRYVLHFNLFMMQETHIPPQVYLEMSCKGNFEFEKKSNRINTDELFQCVVIAINKMNKIIIRENLFLGDSIMAPRHTHFLEDFKTLLDKHRT